MIYILEYPVTQTANSKVNKLALDLEIKAGTTTDFLDSKVVGMVDLQLSFSSLPSTQDITEIESVLSTHQGDTPIFDEVFVNERYAKIVKMLQLAFAHPLLDDLDVQKSKVSLDPYLSLWKESGKSSLLISKIESDADDVNNNLYAFYNTVVNEAGNKTFEYFISVVS